MKLQTTLLVDFYKATHGHLDLYDGSISKLVSYYTPRMSRIKGWDSIPVLGIQPFIQEFLIDHFNEQFFNRPLEEIIEEYNYIIGETLGKNRLNSEKIVKLHKLGYLPLEIRALDEGTICPITVPMFEIINTRRDFAWVTNSIESLMSSELWAQMVDAKVGVEYRKVANEYFEKTVDGDWLTKARSAICDFSYRGTRCHEDALRTSAGFLCSFNKTSTVPAIVRLNHYYGDDLKSIATGMASTEHSISASSYTLDGDEISLLRRLIKQMPDGNFSYVSDTYDYWNFVKNILLELKEEILGRNGTIFVRGDSGDPVKVIIQTVVELWGIFGGTVNSKGYKVLDSHIRAIYGDAITIRRSKEIYKGLEELGFSAENVALGAGSFSMLCLEEENGLQPFTRDTFGVAIKTTRGEYRYYEDQVGYMYEEFDIFKDPKTDTDKFKKSQKGCCRVMQDENGDIFYVDGLSIADAHDEYQGDDKETWAAPNLLTPVFLNGELVKKTTFAEIRNRLWDGNF